MTVNETIAYLQEYVKMMPAYGDYKLVVPIHIEGAVGGTPYLEIQGIYAGIDWDARKLFISLNKDLTVKS